MQHLLIHPYHNTYSTPELQLILLENESHRINYGRLRSYTNDTHLHKHCYAEVDFWYIYTITAYLVRDVRSMKYDTMNSMTFITVG